MTRKWGRPAKDRTRGRKDCDVRALTGSDVCVEHASERNVRRNAREAKQIATERRKTAPLSMTRRAIRMRDDRARDAALYGEPGRAKFHVTPEAAWRLPTRRAHSGSARPVARPPRSPASTSPTRREGACR